MSLDCVTRLLHKNREKMVERNGKPGNWYKCCHCSASRLAANKFFQHVQSHLGKRHQCEKCHAGFSTLVAMNEHTKRMHTNNAIELKCDHPGCQYLSKHPATLAFHKKEKHLVGPRSHRAADSAETVVCPTCSKGLKKWYFQQYHRKTCSAGMIGIQ